MTTPQTSGSDTHENPRALLNKRLETIAWGLFLIMLGGRAFVPDEFVHAGYWSISVGLIMLGLNAARYVNHIRMSSFTTVLGLIALSTGVGELTGLDLPGFGILLMLLGAGLLLKPWLEERKLFGKAEDA